VRVLITGGAGFIGTNLCRFLVENTYVQEIVVVDDFSTGHRANLDPLAVTIIEGTILDDEVLDKAFVDVDAVVHLAALGSVPRSLEDPLSSHEVNATGTLRILEAALRHGSPHTIVASSSSVYGSNPILPKSETLAPQPASPYAASKLAAEAHALAYQACFGLPVMVFRFFNVFGPHQRPDHAYSAAVPRFIAAAIRQEPLVIYGDGGQSRDFTYVGSLVAVIAKTLVSKQCHSGPVNLAFGKAYSLLELIASLATILERDELPTTFRPSRAGDVRHSQADNSLLKELIGPMENVSLSEGLRATVAWLSGQLR
jgi:UDP-glucose 4-epimerase